MQWLSELNPFPSILFHWFLRCRYLFLPSPAWPCIIFLDSWIWYSRFLCNTVLCSIRFYFHHQIHLQLSIFSALAQPLHSFWGYCSSPLLFPSSMLHTFWPWGLIFQCRVFLSFYTVHEVLAASILGWFAIPSSSGSCFIRMLHCNPSIFGGPTMAWLVASLS